MLWIERFSASSWWLLLACLVFIKVLNISWHQYVLHIQIDLNVLNLRYTMKYCPIFFILSIQYNMPNIAHFDTISVRTMLIMIFKTMIFIVKCPLFLVFFFFASYSQTFFMILPKVNTHLGSNSESLINWRGDASRGKALWHYS